MLRAVIEDCIYSDPVCRKSCLWDVQPNIPAQKRPRRIVEWRCLQESEAWFSRPCILNCSEAAYSGHMWEFHLLSPLANFRMRNSQTEQQISSAEKGRKPETKKNSACQLPVFPILPQTPCCFLYEARQLSTKSDFFELSIEIAPAYDGCLTFNKPDHLTIYLWPNSIRQHIFIAVLLLIKIAKY